MRLWCLFLYIDSVILELVHSKQKCVGSTIFYILLFMHLNQEPRTQHNLKFYSTLSTKEIFMGDIPQSTRMCVPFHCFFTIEPLSPLGRQPVQVVLGAINQRFEVQSDPTIHMATKENIII